MELFPKGLVLEAGDGGGGGVWREEGEEERERRGGASALRRPFGRPSRGLSRNPSRARLVPFQGLSSFLSGTFASAVLWPGARSGPRSREKTETTHNVSIVSFN